MYRSALDYPSLAGRSRAERQAIIRSALKEYGGAYRLRSLIVLPAIILGSIFLALGLAGGTPITDWRRWVPPAIGVVLVRAYLSWEINGSIRAAVETYLASRNG